MGIGLDGIKRLTAVVIGLFFGKAKVTRMSSVLGAIGLNSRARIFGLMAGLFLLSGAVNAGTVVSSTAIYTAEGSVGWSTSAVSLSTTPNSLTCTLTPNDDLVVSLPVGATVLRAYLYWANDGLSDPQVTLAGNVINAGQTWNDLSGVGIRYRGYRTDVTSVVTGGGTYNFGGLDSSTTLPSFGSCIAGAQLIVVYEVPVGTTNALSSVSIYDGFEGIRGGSADPLAEVLISPVPLGDITRAILTTMTWGGNSIGESPNYTDLLTLNGTSFGGTDANNGSGANKDNTTDFDIKGSYMNPPVESSTIMLLK